MELKTKKIIAREFIILTTVFFMGLILLLSTFPYNAIIRNKVESQNYKISYKTKLADSLDNNYLTKIENQEWYLNEYINTYSVNSNKFSDLRDKLWVLLKNLSTEDSINYKWENEWGEGFESFNKNLGFSNPQELKTFIERNIITKLDSSNHDSAFIIKSEIYSLSENKNELEKKILSKEERKALWLKILFYCYFILFVIRYLFYCIKWSIKTLKQKTG